MSQSQHSDFASSFYGGEADDSSFILAQPPTPSLTNSTINEHLRRPVEPPPIPSSLQRVGPDRKKSFVLYDQMAHTEWVEWWLQTDFGRRSKFRWDSARHTEVWQNYHQIAHGVDGIPKVMCKRCGKVLEHPYSMTPGNNTNKPSYHGTSTIQKHLKTATCMRSGNGRKSEITNFLRKEVC